MKTVAQFSLCLLGAHGPDFMFKLTIRLPDVRSSRAGLCRPLSYSNHAETSQQMTATVNCCRWNASNHPAWHIGILDRCEIDPAARIPRTSHCRWKAGWQAAAGGLLPRRWRPSALLLSVWLYPLAASCLWTARVQPKADNGLQWVCGLREAVNDNYTLKTTWPKIKVYV